jgi:hypothetical protein
VLRFRSIVTAISSMRKGGIMLVALVVVLLIIALAGGIAFNPLGLLIALLVPRRRTMRHRLLTHSLRRKARDRLNAGREVLASARGWLRRARQAGARGRRGLSNP